MLEELRDNVSWRAAGIAGFAGASVFLLANVILMPLVLDIEPALILRYMAALVLGPEVLIEAGSTPVIIGMVVHYLLSIVFAAVIVIVLHRWGFIVGLIGGAVLGAALYGINMYTLTSFFEWFFAINSGVLFWSHVLFGASVGAIYELFDHYDLPLGGMKHDAPTQ